MLDYLTSLIDFFFLSCYSVFNLERREVEKMSERELRRSLAVFPMSSVMNLTDLTARKIRYYEEQDLIFPERNAGNNRLFSLNDIDRLLDIKEMLTQEFSVKEIKKQFIKQDQKKEQLSEEKIRIALYNDLMRESGLN